MVKRTMIIAAFLVLSASASTGCSGGDSGTAGTGGGASNSGSIQILIGGEDLAASGIAFDPKGDPHLADGWEIAFDHVIVVVDKVTLSENPDMSPTDQSQTGAVVAELDGPWAVDLHKTGPVPGEGGEGEGTAWPLGTIENQNKNGNKPFDETQRYALSYQTVPATGAAKKVSFAGDAETEALYAEMVTKGWTVLYVGTATFKGGSDCKSSDGSYDFTQIPQTAKFHVGYATPVSAINCDNELNQGDPFPGENYQRGIPIFANKASTAQLMFHLDHPYYSDVVHEPALYFGQVAAQAAGKPAGAVITMDDLVGLDPTAFVDGKKQKLPWRVCDGNDLPMTKQMGFGVGTINVNPSGDPSTGFRDYRDFTSYVQSTQTHLNGGNGLCYIKRNYPAPK